MTNKHERNLVGSGDEDAQALARQDRDEQNRKRSRMKRSQRVEEMDSKLREMSPGLGVRRDKRCVGIKVRRVNVGQKKRGRSRRRWEDWINEDLNAKEEDAIEKKRVEGILAPATPQTWEVSVDYHYCHCYFHNELMFLVPLISWVICLFVCSLVSG